ncbi:hypothetical protein LCGC14_0995240 [marine sediment metagenome]|uniref:Uncharacterized protein n=1 Tax=marine sediment metagenome TaxID=412755 RepID=A0A0F9QN30_9ZZZZ
MDRNSKNSRLRRAYEMGHTNVRLVVMILLLLAMIGLAAVSAYADNVSTVPDGVQVFDVAGQTFILWPDGTHEQVCDCASLETDVECYSLVTTLPPTSTADNPNITPEFTGTPEPTVTPMTSNTPLPNRTPRPSCNQGRGNSGEGCDPGNSNNHNPSNDERGQVPGDRGGRGR